MKLTTNSKRLGVFIFFDKDSIIDDYVLYMLDSLNEAVDNILFISNSNVDKSELKKLDKYNIDINIRENKGLDAGAFKYAYDKYSVDYFLEYDEVILLNDTFYGPFKPFKEIIKKMNDKDLDFWGLTANYDSEDGTGKAKDGYIHSHIQTFFVAYRKSVIESDFFKNYWDNYSINKNNSFVDVVNNHESYFTYLLENEGFKWDTYIDLSHYKSNEKDYNYNIYGYSSYTLLNYYDCPFIKRKNFVFNKKEALYLNNGLDTKKSLEWIKNNTDYKVDIIYKNIARLYDPTDIYQSLNMNYVVTEKEKSDSKNLVIAYINDASAYDLSKPYFDNISKSDIILLSNNKINEDIVVVKSLSDYLKDNKKEFIKKYDNICFLNLYDEAINFREVVDSNLVRVLDNAVLNDSYINGICDILSVDKLGVLYLPESMHNKYIMNITGKNEHDIIKNIRLDSNIEDLKHIIKSFDGLWLKSDILNNIPDIMFNMQEFICISEVLLNNTGYLIGKIYNKNYIENDIICMENIYNSYINSKHLELSYPNRMIIMNRAGIIRRIFRKVVPLSIRKKLKKLFKI